VGDRYQIRIPDSIDSKMSAWDLPADIRRLMEERLRDDLATDPLNKLVRCTAPWDERLNLFAFTLPGSEPHIKHMFMFHFVYGEAEQSLDMVECGYIFLNQRPEGPGLFPNLPVT
jgi:hypothetical protein